MVLSVGESEGSPATSTDVRVSPVWRLKWEQYTGRVRNVLLTDGAQVRGVSSYSLGLHERCADVINRGEFVTLVLEDHVGVADISQSLLSTEETTPGLEQTKDLILDLQIAASLWFDGFGTNCQSGGSCEGDIEEDRS